MARGTTRPTGEDRGNGETEGNPRWGGSESQGGERGQDGTHDSDGREATAAEGTAPSGSEEAFVFQTVEVNGPKRRGRKPGSTNRAKSSAADADSIATLFVNVANMLAMGLICPEAAFTPEEQALIVPPLVNMLRRMPSGSVGAVAAWIDPILLCFGLVVWGKRVMAITRPPKEPKDMPIEGTGMHTNGYDAAREQEEAARLERTRQTMGASVS